MTKLHVLLPVHNRREITRRFLECLRTQTYRNYHLVLIDDGSEDGTESMARSLVPDLTLIRGKGDWWWAGSLQQAYDWLKAGNLPSSDMVLIANDDVEFDSDCFQKGVSLLSGQDKALLKAFCRDRRTGRMTDAGVRVDWKRWTFTLTAVPEEVDCLSTRGLFLRLGDFLEIGGFYPWLLPHYTSDYEFTIRARRKGMRLMIAPALTFWDAETGPRAAQPAPANLMDRVRRRFSIKSHGNPILKTVFISLACPWRWKMRAYLHAWGLFDILAAWRKRIAAGGWRAA